jgi:hypothetical protein
MGKNSPENVMKTMQEQVGLTLEFKKQAFKEGTIPHALALAKGAPMEMDYATLHLPAAMLIEMTKAILFANLTAGGLGISTAASTLDEDGNQEDEVTPEGIARAMMDLWNNPGEMENSLGIALMTATSITEIGHKHDSEAMEESFLKELNDLPTATKE